MNCKPGDLAVLIRSELGYEGAIVEVMRFIGEMRFHYPTGLRIVARDCWEVRGRLDPVHMREVARVGVSAGCGAVPDAWLRPIRDQPGEDETLTWAGRPNELPVQIIEKESA